MTDHNRRANQPAPASRTPGVIDAIAHPFANTPLAPGRKGAQERRVALAARELWPPDGQPPSSMGLGERNRAIWRWYAARELPSI